MMLKHSVGAKRPAVKRAKASSRDKRARQFAPFERMGVEMVAEVCAKAGLPQWRAEHPDDKHSDQELIEGYVREYVRLWVER